MTLTRWMRCAVGLVAFGALVALVVGNRSELPAAAEAVRGARPGWLLAGAACLMTWWAAWVLLHASSRRAAGVDGAAGAASAGDGSAGDGAAGVGARVELSRLVPLALGAVAVNSAVKSGGLAGVALFDGDGRARALSRGRVHAGYLLAMAFTDVGFVVTLAAGIALAWWDGQLTRRELLAVALFGVFLAIRAALVVAAARSRTTLRRLWTLPARLWNRIRRYAPGTDDTRDTHDTEPGRQAAQDAAHQAADELYEAVTLLRSRPAAAVVPLVAAVAVDVAGFAMLWTALAAVGGGNRPVTALIAYAVSVLFSIVGVLPGGLGFAEVGVVAVLVSAGSPAGVAAAAAVLFRVWEFWLPLAVGAPLAWYTRHRSHPPQPPPPPVDLAVVVPPKTGQNPAKSGTTTARSTGGGPSPSYRTTRVGGVVRGVAAGAVLFLGGADLVAAASSAVVRRPGMLGVDYAMAAVIGARYVLLAAGVMAVVVSRGVWRGKRVARWLAMVLAVVAAVVSLSGQHVVGRQLGRQLGRHLGFQLGLHLGRHDRWVVVAAFVVLVVLVVGRRAFTARADPALARQGLAVLGAGLASVFGYAVVGLYMVDSTFRQPPSFLSAVRDGVRLLFLLPVRLEPATRHERFLVDSVRVAALTVVAVGLARLVASVVGTPGHEAQRRIVAGILQRHGRTALAHFHLLDDKNWVISDDHEAFVGYAVVGTSAVALGEPVGAPESCVRAVEGFLQLCALNSWTPVFHQVTAAGCDLLAAQGLRLLKIGEEAVVDLASFTLDGRDRKQLRSAVRRCERAGYRVVDLPHPLDDAHLAQLAEVSDAWLASGQHRERTFTLGRFDPDYLRGTPVVAVVDDTGVIQAFANLLPPYGSEDRAGRDATFDLMRRRPEAVNGVMDFLFVALIERFRRDGYDGMNLGLAPLSGAGTGDTVADRVIRVLYKRGAAFNFAGLRAYKDKWGPRWEPRFLAYRFEADLPKVAIAVARAGELPDPRRPLARAVGVVRRFPASIAFAALQLWIMAATAADPRLHRVLLRHYGLAWSDLTHGQVWRLVTGLFIQTRPGFVWGNLALILLVFPIAEWRLGTRRLAAVFIGGDWASTVPVLLGVRIAAAVGTAGAAGFLAERDAGSSSGSYAVVAATLCTIAAPRVRWGLVAALMAGLVVALAVDQKMFDVQHLISAVAVVALSWATSSTVDGRSPRTSPTDGSEVPPGRRNGRLRAALRSRWRAPRVRKINRNGRDGRGDLGHDGGRDLPRDGRDRRTVTGLDGENDEATAGPGHDEAVDPPRMARTGADRIDHDDEIATVPRPDEG